jgi:hypothetical protein
MATTTGAEALVGGVITRRRCDMYLLGGAGKTVIPKPGYRTWLMLFVACFFLWNIKTMDGVLMIALGSLMVGNLRRLTGADFF